MLRRSAETCNAALGRQYKRSQNDVLEGQLRQLFQSVLRRKALNFVAATVTALLAVLRIASKAVGELSSPLDPPYVLKERGSRNWIEPANFIDNTLLEKKSRLAAARKGCMI